ncbi:Ppx/GppA phosphatase [Nitritalea halalkaliphila LW7]|uniref:Ppx/GppA phosphatase n=1 Tax=Nitritalea halalkaliphila LW7 TaxID=1189621 RepID=I5CA28_9BACT|nr:exopolyphosphatase [Nitritalea halalkaliphila]EIM78680.1 Ppx/GppA phosphatase [Nitritalea halalkaliphila LW7]
MSFSKAAIIDLGTNTFHLLIVELLEQQHFRTVYKEKIPVKLGEGGISKNILSEAAMKRGLHTLQHFAQLLAAEEVTHLQVFGTSALRNARNSGDFLLQVRQRFGFDIQIIDGDTEALLIYEGIRLSGALKGERALMMDIGGGSVEFIIGSEERVDWKQSFEIGGQRLMDRFHQPEARLLPSEQQDLHCYLQEALLPLAEAIQHYQPKRLVGASGTFDTLHDMDRAAAAKGQPHKREKYLTHALPLERYQKMAKKILESDREARLQLPGMIPMRADMIVVAICLIDHILTLLPEAPITCTSYALKEGAVARIFNSTLIS